MRVVRGLALVILITLVGCAKWDAKQRAMEVAGEERSYLAGLPSGAINVIWLGSGWSYFSMGGRMFLYRHVSGYAGNDCITEISR